MDLASLAEALKPFVLRWVRPRVSWYAATNARGSVLSAGDVVVVGTGADSTVTVSTTSADRTVAGVVVIGGENGETVYVATAGVVDVKVLVAVTRGQFLQQSGVAGKALGMIAFGAGAFGIAVETGSTMVKALIGVPAR